MFVDLSSENPALESIFDDPILNRRPPARKAFDFQLFQSIWLDPIFNIPQISYTRSCL